MLVTIARKKTLEALNRQAGRSAIRSLMRQMKEVDPGFAGDIRVASELIKPPKISSTDNELGGHLKRAIPKEYEYDPRALKPLAKMLWAMSVSLGHAMTAHRQFTKLKSSTVSPDGLVGGRGYVMAVKDIRKALYDACEALSAISDTIHDEIHAPHWKPKLAQLEKEDAESVERLVGEAEKILDDPEGEIEDDMEEVEEEGTRWDSQKDDPKSSMPDGDDLADNVPAKKHEKQASVYSYDRSANSSQPVETLPGGPRVDHLDRADTDQTGPFGSYNRDEVPSDDNWARTDGVGNEYAYQSDWDNDLRARSADSALPDHNSDPTPTEGYDYGIGRGDGNDAHGQGVEYAGTPGPASETPSDHDGIPEMGDSTPSIELSVSQSSMPKHASELPNDNQPPVARSDYYDGPKGGNLVDSAATKLPGEQLPAKDTPLTPRPAHLGEHMFGTSAVPGDEGGNYEYDRGTPNVGHSYERVPQAYIKWDSNTHNMRPDDVYQRDVEGPYVKQEG